MMKINSRSRVVAAVGGAVALLATLTGPTSAASDSSALASTLNCIGSITVNIGGSGAVDGKGNLRCATPSTSYDAQLTLSGSVTNSSGLVYETRTSDRLSIFNGSSGEVIDLTVNRRLERLSSGASGNATARGAGMVIGGGPFGGARQTESGTGTFGTGRVTTFLITDNYIFDLNG
ncbi:hypothetical protein ACFWBN_24315 [Streptomyces sp. NPDC059989]|uniref:hypothetical protein n=1 Tax=Streptomyces sp. NPDC059989 TaxID=3347026 RepID=UPI00367D7BA8